MDLMEAESVEILSTTYNCKRSSYRFRELDGAEVTVSYIMYVNVVEKHQKHSSI